MAQKPLYEISRIAITLAKTEEPVFIWQNSVLSVRTEKSLNLLKFTYNLQCLDKKIDCAMAHIPCSKTSPASDLFPNKLLKNLGNFEFTQLIVNPSFWPHNNQIMEEMASMAAFDWSPPLMHNEGFIAILNNVGNVELYGAGVCGYVSVLNVSSIIKQDNLLSTCPKSLDELKSLVYAVETSAICWGFERNGSVPFLTAQKNGDIYLWLLRFCNKKLKLEHLTTQKTNGEEIVTMKVIPLINDMFILIFANEMGQLFVNKYKWDNDNLQLVKSNCLWTHKDRMLVKHISYCAADSKIILLCNKHRHLLVLMMDDDCTKITEYVNNVNDYKITGISEMNNEFYVAMINCNVFKVQASASGDVLNVNITPIMIKENFVEKELFGVQFSKNNVICALVLVDRKMMIRKENIPVDIVFLCEEDSHNKEIACLLHNPTRKLTDYWDCIEMIRYKAMKFKVMPTIDYKQLYTDCSTDSYMLKVYYILVILYNNLEKILKNNSKGWLPETSIDVVREKILMLHSKCIIMNIYRQFQSNDYLIDLEKESFVGAKKFLDYYCQKYKVDRNEIVPNHVWNIIEVDCAYTCQCCDEIVIGFTCVNGHLNMFCALTLTPIEGDDYLVCKGCCIVARIELQMESPLCIFCDLHLNNYSLPS